MAWQEVKAMIASDLVEESLEIADQAEERGVPAARLRVEQRRWMAHSTEDAEVLLEPC